MLFAFYFLFIICDGVIIPVYGNGVCWFSDISPYLEIEPYTGLEWSVKPVVMLFEAKNTEWDDYGIGCIFRRLSKEICI